MRRVCIGEDVANDAGGDGGDRRLGIMGGYDAMTKTIDDWNNGSRRWVVAQKQQTVATIGTARR